MKILVHLVSGQNVPNYIAAKMLNPDKNIFLYSEESEKQQKDLRKVLCIERNCESIKINAWDYIENYKLALGLIEKYLYDEIILNFTGGTKIASLAYFSAFRDKNKKTIYINTEKDICSEFLFEGSEFNEDDKTINIKGNLDEYFGLSGQILKSKEYSYKKEYRELRDLLNNRFLLYSSLSFKVAKLFNENKDMNVEPIPEGNFKGSIISYNRIQSKLSIIFKGKKVFDYVDSGSDLLKYFTGGWFEHLCFEKFKALNIFDDIRLNSRIDFLNKIDNDKVQDKNEIDILAIKGIYPFVFECKSGGFNNENIDRLISLKDYIGRYADIYLITFMDLNPANSFHNMLLEKMREKHIKHITYKQINSLLFMDKKSNIK